LTKFSQNYRNRQWLSARAILEVKKYDVNTINITILNEILNLNTTYQSIDTVMKQDKVVKYPTELLNSLDMPGMLPHVYLWIFYSKYNVYGVRIE